MDNILEKYLDTSVAGIEYTLKKYIAGGWYIYFEGLTMIILRKEL
jgi:hypothetical protein